MSPEALIRSVARMGVAPATSDEDQVKLMNNRQNGRRRGRGGQQVRNGQPGVPDRGSRVDNRARGNAAQLLEKYKSLARDAQMVGDRVNTEYYLQFADHYFRVLSENRSRFEDNRPPDQQRRRDEYRDGDDGMEGEDMAADDDGYDEGPRAPASQPSGNGWNGRESEVAEPPRAEPRRERAPREAVELPPRAAIADEGERYREQRPRRNRNARGADDGAPSVSGAASPPPPAPERIEVDRLPQGFGTAPVEAGPATDEAPAPRRRAPRRPRPEASPAEA